MKDFRLEISPRVYNILLDFLKSLKIKTLGISSKWQNKKQILTIYTTHVGLIIGKQGSTLQQLLDKIYEDILDRDIDIVLEEVGFFIRDDNESYTDKEFTEFMNEYLKAKGI